MHRCSPKWVTISDRRYLVNLPNTSRAHTQHFDTQTTGSTETFNAILCLCVQGVSTMMTVHNTSREEGVGNKSMDKCVNESAPDR